MITRLAVSISRGRVNHAAPLSPGNCGYATFLKATASCSAHFGRVPLDSSASVRAGTLRHAYQSTRLNSAVIASPRIKVVMEGIIISPALLQISLSIE